MSLKLKVIRINLGDEESPENYYLSFNMDSINYYKETFSRDAIKDIMAMNTQDVDVEVLLRLFASMVKEQPYSEPLGVEFVAQYSPFGIITEFAEDIVNCVVDSLPKGNGVAPKKK
ncbi:MAG: hypothetical protein E6789_08285 [Clostridium baratii]|nr:hypothetical protein [Clostridium baratii]